MQLGTENRNKTIAAVGLMVVALAMVVMRFFPGSPASAKTPTPVVAPPTPPINLKFFGFASKPGQPKKIFLSQGEDVFIAGEGDIIDRRYRILHITPVSVEVEDVLNNNCLLYTSPSPRD